ncbi:hypothetical protein NDU88_002071 [Pleurodeles waltl]|uniref:Uncharacterized protein n=1 Tax=Pleurodeles waltl TaxID=8319 RepID=A0AAV7UX97_PLEWA|nr:hypothetical protein NDU88_002071 [Pleurodeles waltl]
MPDQRSSGSRRLASGSAVYPHTCARGVYGSGLLRRWRSACPRRARLPLPRDSAAGISARGCRTSFLASNTKLD